MTDCVFDVYSRYYDLLYRDKDYRAEVSYILSLLSDHGISRGNLLEFGSGTGRHGTLLAEQGFKVTGIERSASMIARSQRMPGFTCQQGDICTVRLGRKFDAVLSLFHVVSYQITYESVFSVFMRASDHLEPGGIFLFDIWYSPAVFTQKPQLRLKRMEEENIKITRIAEPTAYPNESRVDVKYTIYAQDVSSLHGRIIQELHSMRHFSLQELDLLAQLTGFERVRAEEFLSGDVLSERTWSACLLMRKLNV
jgi:SAM-dependent methyltransferase